MSRLRGYLFDTPPDQIAGTVYGTIVVMAAIAAGSHGEPDAGSLAAVVASTVLVFWFAHVYSEALGETIALNRRLDWAEVGSIARREFAIPLAAVAPVTSLLLGALGVLEEATAGWIAVLFGLATLVVQGVRYANVEHMSRLGGVVSVAVNLAVGLAIIGLKAGLSH
ncbi:MAG TPA: hypothetical protein VFL61_10135 [Gaiellaceae bacterium]|nr:hypothetical protein [Gaiellaceae bacterium]